MYLHDGAAWSPTICHIIAGWVVPALLTKIPMFPKSSVTLEVIESLSVCGSHHTCTRQEPPGTFTTSPIGGACPLAQHWPLPNKRTRYAKALPLRPPVITATPTRRDSATALSSGLPTNRISHSVTNKVEAEY